MGPGDIFDSSLIPSGWGGGEGEWRASDNRSHMWWRDRGYHVSWDNPGMEDLHYTNHNLPKGHPGRHMDPRG